MIPVIHLKMWVLKLFDDNTATQEHHTSGRSRKGSGEGRMHVWPMGHKIWRTKILLGIVIFSL